MRQMHSFLRLIYLGRFSSFKSARPLAHLHVILKSLIFILICFSNTIRLISNKQQTFAKCRSYYPSHEYPITRFQQANHLIIHPPNLGIRNQSCIVVGSFSNILFNKRTWQHMEAIKTNRKQLKVENDHSQIQNNILSQPKQPQGEFFHALKNLITFILQNNRFVAGSVDFTSVTYALPVAYLIKLHSYLSVKMKLPLLENQLLATTEKLNPFLQNAVYKYEFPHHMRLLYRKIMKQQISIKQLQYHFRNFFYDFNHKLYEDREIWNQLAECAVFQFADQQTWASPQNKHKYLSWIQQLQTCTKERLRNEQHQQLIQQQKLQQKLTAAISDCKMYQLTMKSKGQQKRLTSELSRAIFKQNLNVKTIMLLEINFDIITLVTTCQTYQAPFLLFLVPFTYLLAETLSYYEKASVQNISIYHLFQELIKKINLIKTKKHSQLTEKQLMNHIVLFANYFKHSPLELNKGLGQFLSKHGEKMKGFIPVYYDIFSFLSFEKYQFIQGLQGIKDAKEKRKKLLERIQRLHEGYQKYNSEQFR